MKKYSTFVLVFLMIGASAQNYQNICTPGITFFEGYTNKVLAFRLDSIQALPNGDTVFTSYRTIRDTIGSGCLDITHGGILGRKVIRSDSGWFYFFNRNGDTLKINPNADVNQTWKFCELSNNGYLQARINQILFDSVLGYVDYVKIITLQAKNAANSNIPHKFNLCTIKLSKHAGLTKFFDVYNVPYDTASFFLAGKSEPATGLQNLTMQQIFDHDTGDVFHLTGYEPRSSWQVIKKVIGKTVYGNNDSVVYKWERCRKLVIFPNLTVLHDTVNEKINFVNGYFGTIFQNLPDEFISMIVTANEFSFRTDKYYTRDTKGIVFDAYLFYGPPWGNCWGNNFGYEHAYETDEYAEGLGRTMHNVFYTPPTQTFVESLVYYKKGNETWGTPLAESCMLFVGVPGCHKEEMIQLTINPNPVETSAVVDIIGSIVLTGTMFRVYNLMGQVVYQEIPAGNRFSFNRQGLPSGLYVMALMTTNGQFLAKAKVVFY